MNAPDRPSCLPVSARRFSRRGTQGITLVETVIALGIVSFAMVSILGMIPVGLSNFQSAQHLTIESSIVQGVTGELQRTDVTNLSSTNLYFDDQGRASTAAKAIYTVKVGDPQNLDASNLISSTAAKSVLLTVNNRSRPSLTNHYSVIIVNGP